uniref:Uncharacterized protein n=1 Tax=Acrobeloides nanus TaxID=290746 RepID=A0A914DE89_9BILA
VCCNPSPENLMLQSVPGESYAATRPRRSQITRPWFLET